MPLSNCSSCAFASVQLGGLGSALAVQFCFPGVVLIPAFIQPGAQLVELRLAAIQLIRRSVQLVFFRALSCAFASSS